MGMCGDYVAWKRRVVVGTRVLAGPGRRGHSREEGVEIATKLTPQPKMQSRLREGTESSSHGRERRSYEQTREQPRSSHIEEKIFIQMREGQANDEAQSSKEIIRKRDR